jgi:hypothetical protein
VSYHTVTRLLVHRNQDNKFVCVVFSCYRTLRQFTRKQHFVVPTQTQWTVVLRLSPENKYVSHYIPLQAGYRSKKQSSAHKWLHVTLLAISFPQCYVTFFMFQFFRFYLSALLSLPPASLSEEHSLSVSLLVLLPATKSQSL